MPAAPDSMESIDTIRIFEIRFVPYIFVCYYICFA